MRQIRFCSTVPVSRFTIFYKTEKHICIWIYYKRLLIFPPDVFSCIYCTEWFNMLTKTEDRVMKKKSHLDIQYQQLTVAGLLFNIFSRGTILVAHLITQAFTILYMQHFSRHI